MKILASLLLLAATTAQPAPVEYRFDNVKRNVTLMTANQETRAASGTRAQSGDRVETGWFSYALIASEGHRAKFEIFSATDVTLADGTAGVILSVERGRIRAAFDKITGSEPRIVQTPGALLAVRGTKFDVEVNGTGDTIVDVFEGLVEVRSSMIQEPVFIRPGQQSTFGRREAPEVREMPEDRRRRAPEGANMPPPIGRQRPDGEDGMRGPRDGSRPAPEPGRDGMGGKPHDSGQHPSQPPPQGQGHKP